MPNTLEKLSNNAKLGPVHLRVTDMPRASRFWFNVVGLNPIASDDGRLDLRVAGRTLIALHQGALGPAPTKSVGLFHLALNLPSRLELARAASRLLRAGASPVGQDHLAAESVYFSDPDGNRIELYVSTPDRAQVNVVNGWPLFQDRNGVSHSGLEPLDIKRLLIEITAHGEGDGCLPEDTNVGHIHLRSNEPEICMKFYTEVIGFTPHIASVDFGMFDCGTEAAPHMIALNMWGGRQLPRTSTRNAGLAAYTVQLPQTELAGVRSRLAEVRANISDGIELICEDPDGNRIYIVPHS